MAESFPLPGSSLKIIRLILVGYLHQGGSDRKPAGPSEVGSAIGTDATIVSRNNAFLAAIGLIEKEGRQWRLTDDGVPISRAFEYDAADEIRASLGPRLRTVDFVKTITTFLRSRGGVEQTQLAEHIARVAGAPKKAAALTGARTVIDLLVASGIASEDGSLVGLRRASTSEDAAGTNREGPTEVVEVAERAAIRRSGGAAVNLNIEISLSMSDLKTDTAADELATRLRLLIDRLA